MIYTVTVPDEYNTELGNRLGKAKSRLLEEWQGDPNEAIQEALDHFIKTNLIEIIKQDPEVLAAKQVYEAKVAQKTAAINVAGK